MILRVYVVKVGAYGGAYMYLALLSMVQPLQRLAGLSAAATERAGAHLEEVAAASEQQEEARARGSANLQRVAHSHLHTMSTESGWQLDLAAASACLD